MNALFSNNLLDLLDDANAETLRLIQIDAIDPDPDQPRKEFNDESLREMAESLKTEGQITPIEVTDIGEGRYMLVVGERRWRAAQYGGIRELEAKIKVLDSRQRLRRQLIENLQREDMSALDTANAIKRLVETEGSAVAAAKAIGKSKGQVSKYLAVLSLPPITSDLAGTRVTRDVETLTTLANIERENPEMAQAIVEDAKKTGKIRRSDVREHAKSANGGFQGMQNIQNQGIQVISDDSDKKNASTELQRNNSESVETSDKSGGMSLKWENVYGADEIVANIRQQAQHEDGWVSFLLRDLLILCDEYDRLKART